MNPMTCTRSALLTTMVLTIIPLQIRAELELAPTNGAQEHGISLILGALVVRAPQFVGNRDAHHSRLLPWIALEGERWFLDTSSPDDWIFGLENKNRKTRSADTTTQWLRTGR